MNSIEIDDLLESSCVFFEELYMEVMYIYDVLFFCSEDFDIDFEDLGEKKYIVVFRKYVIYINYSLLFNNE